MVGAAWRIPDNASPDGELEREAVLPISVDESTARFFGDWRSLAVMPDPKASCVVRVTFVTIWVGLLRAMPACAALLM